MTEKKNHTSNPGVGCDVIACKYNTVDCRCNAGIGRVIFLFRHDTLPPL